MEMTFSIDLITFLRLFIAFLWGCGWAATLQWTRSGQFLAQERTWITVVVGVGVDMAIAYPGDWWLIFGVLACSSIGIIFRSLNNELSQPVEFRRNKVRWNIDDALALAVDLNQSLARLIEIDLPQPAVRELQRTLSLVNRIRHKLRDAGRGEYTA